MLICDECAFSRSFWRTGYRNIDERLRDVNDNRVDAPESWLFELNPKLGKTSYMRTLDKPGLMALTIIVVLRRWCQGRASVIAT